MEVKNMLTGVAARLSSLREERPSAGTKYRLMGMVADITEVTEMLSKEVLERVKQEAVLDVDVDVDFDVMAEEVLSWELTTTKEELQENTQLVNDALGGLNDVLTQINSQLGRHHRDDEYERLYESEKRRYLNSGTPHRARKTFEEWKDLCHGTPTQDGYLVVNAAHAGQHFYASRHEENAKAHRNAFMKYMHKITLAQEERRKLLEAEATQQEAPENALNYFAPSKNLKTLLAEEWFEIHRTDRCYDTKWTEDFVNSLMKSEHRDYIATEWSKDKRQDYIRGCLLGLLKEGGVIKGSMDSIARSANVCENYRTFSKYMGQCRQEPYADWALDYVRQSAK